MNISENLSGQILELARRENTELMQKLGLGIFDMPELAFAYLAGKTIAMNAESILGGNNYEWRRETDFGNGGPTDLAFTSTSEGISFLIEFKLDDTIYAYRDDIKKLQGKLNDRWANRQWKKHFCALKWVLHEKQGNEFLESMKAMFGPQADLIQHTMFETYVQNKKKQFCLYSFWETKQDHVI